MLGVQGARGRRACLGRAGVARSALGGMGAGRHGCGHAGRWSARARGTRQGERAWAPGRAKLRKKGIKETNQ